MDKKENLPDLDHSMSLSPEKNAQFQEEIVWPAIDYIWGGDFRESCQPGVGMTKRVQMDDAGEIFCELEISLDIGLDEADEEDTESVIIASLTVEELSDEILVELIDAHKSQLIKNSIKGVKSSRKRRSVKRKVNREFDETEYDAYSLTVYNFNTFEGNTMQVTRHFELRDSSNSVVWSSQKAMDGECDFDPEARLLNEEFASSITYEDCFTLKAAFQALNVPAEVLQKTI